MINTKEKQEYFSRQKIDIVGTSDDMNTYIYKLSDDGIMFREAVIDSGRGGDPVEILHSTDFHLNCLNAAFEQKSPMNALIAFNWYSLLTPLLTSKMGIRPGFS